MAPHPQLPVCIFTKLAASLASSCKSASPGISQRLPAAPSRLPCVHPFASLTLACLAQKLLGSNFEEGRQAWLPLPAMHTRLRRAIIRFEWSRVAWSPWTWRKAGSHGRSFLVWDTGHSIGGGFAPGLGAGLPWRRCKMQSKAKDGRTLHLFQGAWFEPFGQHVFADA